VKGTIRHPEELPDEYGEILYPEASITGNEPRDVLNYKRETRNFRRSQKPTSGFLNHHLKATGGWAATLYWATNQGPHP